MATTLAFSTPPGWVVLPAGKTVDLGTVDVHTFDQVRVFAKQTYAIAGTTVVQLILMEGSNTVGNLDTLDVGGTAQITRVYEVPGTTLSISANTPGAFGAEGCVDVWVWGAAD